MAFEAFLERDDVRPRRRRRVTYTVSLIIHAALLALGIAYSFWRVDEISPPSVHVMFMAGAPPPPAPPPPPGGAGAAVHKKIAPKVIRPTVTELVQPRLIPPKKEEPKADPNDDDDPDRAFAGGTKAGAKGGVIGGTIGGTAGGTPGGTIGGVADGTPLPPRTSPPRMVAPQMGAKQKAFGDDPEFPAILRRAGTLYVVLAKVCVSRTGRVDAVSILKGADPMLDAKVISAVKEWRYSPLLADSNAVPFCYPLRFEFKSD